MRSTFKGIAYALPYSERKSEFTTDEVAIPFNSLRSGNGSVSGGNVRSKYWYSPTTVIPVVGTTYPKKGTYTASTVEIPVPLSFDGEGISVNLRVYVQQFSVYRNRMIYSWALSSSNSNRDSYIAFGDAGIYDSNQIGFGVFECPYNNAIGNTGGNYRSFRLECNKKFKGNGTAYLYLFPKVIQSSDNVHIASHTTGSAADSTAVVDATYNTFISINYLR